MVPLFAVIDLKDALRRSSHEGFAVLTCQAPGLVGDARRDAFLAAIVKDEAARKAISPLAGPMIRVGSIGPSGISPGARDSIPGRSPTLLERSFVMVCLLPKRNLRVSDLNRDEIESAIAELADRLNASNVKAKIYLVGGAVMVLAFDARFTTGDIDGAIHPTDDLLAVAAEIGERRGLVPNGSTTRHHILYRHSRSPTGSRYLNRGTLRSLRPMSGRCWP